jgi:hypothetical protein
MALRVNSPPNFNNAGDHVPRVANMALPLPPGLTPPEIAFLCEMELVTVIPRQRLEGLELLGVCVPLRHPTTHSEHSRLVICIHGLRS